MPKRKSTLCLEHYDCIGFDLDHTLCRYNIGPMIRLEYRLLTEFLVNKKGYDPAIKLRRFDDDQDVVCKGLTLDIDRGNLLRLGHDGTILTAMHGTKRLTDFEIEKVYGRCRKKHTGSDYTQHLNEFGPMKNVDFRLHNFMDYFDIAAPLVCMRIVDVLDEINNNGKPMEEYFFWPDVQEGLKDMYVRTQFAADMGGYFPEIKAHPEKYILKRRPEFRQWLKSLRDNGKYLYVITGSHFDFASFVASYAIGSDWKDLFDIVIFFARKPSFFHSNRPFWRLDGPNEVESFLGWEDLESGEYYSQGNWKDLNEFLEYCTEWEPTTCLYFGDNVLQDVLAPKKFTTTIDSVAVSEEMFAEGMVDQPDDSHPHAADIVSSVWGSYFYYPRLAKKHPKHHQNLPKSTTFQKNASFDGSPSSAAAAATSGLPPPPPTRPPSAQSEEMKRAITLRRVSSLKNTSDDIEVAKMVSAGYGGVCSQPPLPPTVQPSLAGTNSAYPNSVRQRKITPASAPQSRGATPAFGLPPTGGQSAAAVAAAAATSDPTATAETVVRGPERINTLWGTMVRDYAKMCIPDVDVLIDYPIDYRFPAFGRDKQGSQIYSGFFPADPKALHADPETLLPNKLQASALSNLVNASKRDSR